LAVNSLTHLGCARPHQPLDILRILLYHSTERMFWATQPRRLIMPPRLFVSARMLAANRANARRSTGPRTPEGKARSRRNALVHGLRAGKLAPPLLATDEDRAAFAELVAGLRAEFTPASPLEEALIRSLAEAYLGLCRAARAEAAAIVAAATGADADPPTLSVAAMAAILRYEAPFRRRFNQAVAMLLELQAAAARAAIAAHLSAQPHPPAHAEESTQVTAERTHCSESPPLPSPGANPSCPSRLFVSFVLQQPAHPGPPATQEITERTQSSQLPPLPSPGANPSCPSRLFVSFVLQPRPPTTEKRRTNPFFTIPCAPRPPPRPRMWRC